MCCCLLLHTSLDSEQKSGGAVQHTSARKRCFCSPRSKAVAAWPLTTCSSLVLCLPEDLLGPHDTSQGSAATLTEAGHDSATHPSSVSMCLDRLCLKLPSVMNSLMMPQRECQALLTPHDKTNTLRHGPRAGEMAPWFRIAAALAKDRRFTSSFCVRLLIANSSLCRREYSYAHA